MLIDQSTTVVQCGCIDLVKTKHSGPALFLKKEQVTERAFLARGLERVESLIQMNQQNQTVSEIIMIGNMVPTVKWLDYDHRGENTA